MSEATAEKKQLSPAIANGVRLVGDTLVAPGTSLLIDGKIGAGAGRVVAGLVARAAIGPIGWLAIAADSYTKSTTGRGILDRMLEGKTGS